MGLLNRCTCRWCNPPKAYNKSSSETPNIMKVINPNLYTGVNPCFHEAGGELTIYDEHDIESQYYGFTVFRYVFYWVREATYFFSPDRFCPIKGAIMSMKVACKYTDKELCFTDSPKVGDIISDVNGNRLEIFEIEGSAS